MPLAYASRFIFSRQHSQTYVAHLGAYGFVIGPNRQAVFYFE
jgi:hypothetical protein